MALINCPDCNTIVSDKAIQCPKCAYPISSLNVSPNQTSIQIPKSENITLNIQQPNLNQHVIMLSKKSEGLAFLLIFLFGPLGLLYSNPKKVIGVFGITFAAVMLCIVMNNEEESYRIWVGLVALISWIISFALGIQGVNEYNSSLLLNENDRNINNKDSLDHVEQLRKLIKEEKHIPFYAPSKKEKIIELLNEICINKVNTELLMREYKTRYSHDLVENLKNLSSSYVVIKQNISKFIEFGFVENEFPYNNIITI